MSAVAIDRMRLRLHGVTAELAQSALDGLDAELMRRLSVRGVDAAALRALSPSIRLPAIDAPAGVDAEHLRGLIADGLVELLSPRPPATDTEAA